MPKQIEITCHGDGSITVEAVGFKGKGCKQATEAFEKALGEVKTDTKKSEFYLTEQTKLKQTV